MICKFIKNIFKKKAVEPVKWPSSVIPFSNKVNGLELKSRGFYKNLYPQGAVLHYTAGRHRLAKDEFLLAQKNDYNFLLIDGEGQLWQQGGLTQWGSHAGISSWPDLGDYLSSKLVGIEIMCAGKVDHDERYDCFKSWYGEEFSKDEVRHARGENGVTRGYYQKFTKAQEETLFKTLLWLKENNPTVFNIDYVLAHHEVSPSRKQDVGGSLSMSMGQLRAKLRHDYEYSKQVI